MYVYVSGNGRTQLEIRILRLLHTSPQSPLLIWRDERARGEKMEHLQSAGALRACVQVHMLYN